MCQYAWMAAVGNYALLASPAAVLLFAAGLLLIAVAAPDRRRSALCAAAAIGIPVCIMPFAAVGAFACAMGHQMVCPGLEIHAITAMLGVLALASAIGCPLVAWRRAARGRP